VGGVLWVPAAAAAAAKRTIGRRQSRNILATPPRVLFRINYTGKGGNVGGNLNGAPAGFARPPGLLLLSKMSNFRVICHSSGQTKRNQGHD